MSSSTESNVQTKLIQFPVSGISFKKKNVQYILNLKNIHSPFQVELLPEPTNKYDKKAIKVIVGFENIQEDIYSCESLPLCIGYVPRNMTKHIAPHLEQGKATLLDIGEFHAGYYARVSFKFESES